MGGMKGDVAIVFMTVPDQECAERVAAALVGEDLAACVNVVPGVVSHYRWQGRTERDAELLMIAKTVQARVAALVQRVRALHPYEVPEVVAVPVVGGYGECLSWIRASVGGAEV